jgi:hypothetical protein
VISGDVEREMPIHVNTFMEGCGLGVVVKRAGKGARAFAEATKLVEDASMAAPIFIQYWNGLKGGLQGQSNGVGVGL